MKTIHIRECSRCPYFTEFPADYYDGDCTKAKIKDTRISDKYTIPSWCPI